MAGYLEDLDELVLKCRNKNAREYIRESVASYRAEAYRSSIVSCWVAVCYDLIEKLRELSLAGDKQAEKKIDELNELHRNGDTIRSLKFERELLAFARDKVELISNLECEDLDRIQKDRHRCAHPSLNAEGEQYAPPAELARLHIHSAVTHLLQHEPAQGKFALERILAQLHSEYFPSGRDDVLRAFQNNPVRRARPSLVRNLISVLLKDLFLLEQEDYTICLKITASLSAVCTMHRVLYEERLVEVLPDIVSRIKDKNLHFLASNISRFPSAWEALGHTQQTRLTSYIARLPTQDFHIIEDLLSFEPVRKTAIRRVKYASLKDLDAAFLFFAAPKEIIDRYIELYHGAGSFDEANKIASLLKTYADDFNAAQIKELISNLNENDQVLGSFEFPQVLNKFREVSKKYEYEIEFEAVLENNGLGFYCIDLPVRDDEKPF